MDSNRDYLSLQRRMMVSSVLSPPSVCLSRFLKGWSLDRDVEGAHPPNTQGPCRLCWCDQAGTQTTQLVRQTLKDLLAQVGLDLDEDSTFCLFCLTQLQNLVTLKKEMDLMGERLASMIIGLHTLLTETTRDPQVLSQEEDEPMIRTTGLGPLAAAVPNIMGSVTNVDQTISPPDVVVLDEYRQPESLHIIDLSGNVDMTDADLWPKEMLVAGANDGKGGTPKDINNTPNECIKRFVCPQCNKGFQTRRHLAYHSKTHASAGPKSFKCHLCSVTFYNKGNVKRHILTHRPEQERPFACPQLNCPRRFITKQNLRVHINRHLSFEEGRFTQNEQLKAHCDRHVPLHDDNDGCGRHSRFGVINPEDSQVELQPISPEPLSIHDVDKTTDSEISNPSVNDSLVEVQVQCSKETFVAGCSNSSAGNRDELVQQGNAEKEEWLMCSDSNQGFTIQGHLTQHSQVHFNTKPFACQVCSLRFKRKQQLTQHGTTHLPEEVRRLRCPQCPRRFLRKFNLDMHVYSHLPVGERPYACHICPRRFTGKFELKIHVNGHLPPHEQPFPCRHCLRRFPSKRQLKGHVRTHLQRSDGIVTTGRPVQQSIPLSSISLAQDVDAVPLIVHEKVDLEDTDE